MSDLIMAHSVSGVAPLVGFTSTWDTTLTSTGSSTSTQVKLPLVSSGTYNFNVDWGDGSNTDITTWNVGNTHTYSSSGIYTISITGTINGWQFNNTGDRKKILEILQFDALNIKDYGAFHGCSNMIITATDNFSSVGLTSTGNMYRECTSLTEVPLIDLSSVVNVGNMFYLTTLSTTSYSNFLNDISTQSLQSNKIFNGGFSKYNAGASVARSNIIATYGWSITDGGLE